MVKVETGRENRTRSGQDDGTIAEFGFETIECCMQIGEEGRILCVDLLGVHAHHCHMRVLALNGPRHRTILQYLGSWSVKNQNHSAFGRCIQASMIMS